MSGTTSLRPGRGGPAGVLGPARPRPVRAPGEERVSIGQLGADLHAVLTAVAPGPGPVVLVGHSMGGMTIMALARLHPELFGPKVDRGGADLQRGRGVDPTFWIPVLLRPSPGTRRRRCCAASARAARPRWSSGPARPVATCLPGHPVHRVRRPRHQPDRGRLPGAGDPGHPGRGGGRVLPGADQARRAGLARRPRPGAGSP